jgi:hypothetical protein
MAEQETHHQEFDALPMVWQQRLVNLLECKLQIETDYWRGRSEYNELREYAQMLLDQNEQLKADLAEAQAAQEAAA